jgi:uncharacterized membrane protein
MKTLLENFKKTLFQGILFLGPILIALVLADKIFEKFIHIITPIADFLPFHSILGVGKAYWAAILLLVTISLLMGLIANMKLAQRFLEWLENNVLMLLPGYMFMKQMRESIFAEDSINAYKVILVQAEEGWQLAYLIEEIDENNAAVFIPDVPNPSEGNLLYMSKEKIKEVNISYKESLKILKRHGVGSAAYLKGVL